MSSSLPTALVIALLAACGGGTARESASTPSVPDTADRPGFIAAFGDSAAPDTVSTESPPARQPASHGVGQGGSRPPQVPSTSDTASAPTIPTGPGVVDTAPVGPAAPGVVDTAPVGHAAPGVTDTAIAPGVNPNAIWRQPAGTFDTAAAVLPRRRALTAPARNLPGAHP